MFLTRGAPLGGAGSRGATALDARWAPETRARQARELASLSPSAVPPEPRALDVARRAIVRVSVVDPPAGRSDDGGRPNRTGFGFVVTDSGTILTAGRLVTGATKVAVVLSDGRTLPATTVTIDPLNELAVLQVKGARLRAVPLGRSGDLRVGDPLVTLGDRVAGGVVGTVRATGAATGGELVTDARPTGEPRAGLPLLNVRGEAVGIVTHTSDASRGTPLDFAVPIDRAKRVLRDLGPPTHGLSRNEFPGFASDR